MIKLKNDKTLEVLVISQFIKDMSFENFRTREKTLKEINYKLNINVNVEKADDVISNVVLHLFCEASDEIGNIYILEIQYGGSFKISCLEKKERRRILMVDCPNLLFPFLRRLAYDITKEGGGSPLNIKPMDFSSFQDKT
ncbi:MAG: protein-export chaperone SecB [Paracoccaceae bacterium]|nr:protein-export chaperone SecB [Paracoccaceae bacterium]